MLHQTYRAAFLGTILALTTAIGFAQAPAAHAPIVIHERHGKNSVTSTNWSGYAVTGAKGSVTDVKASWVVPAVTCPATGTQYSSFWVGIDGYSSNTVEQIGTDSDCVDGVATYYAWYEFYPHPSYNINSVTVKPGDVISAEVRSGAKGSFTVTLQAGSEKAFSVSTKVASADLSSAEWIAEAPWSGGVLPLADFAVVNNGNDFTGVADTDYATIGGGKSAPVGSFADAVAITMVNSSGAQKAAPSPLSHDGSSFSIAWESAGP